jgi:hypothetical protein
MWFAVRCGWCPGDSGEGWIDWADDRLDATAPLDRGALRLRPPRPRHRLWPPGRPLRPADQNRLTDINMNRERPNRQRTRRLR